MNGRSRFSGGRYHQKSPISNPGGRGAPSPPAMEVERRAVGGQFQQKLFAVQYTIDCEKENSHTLRVGNIFQKTKILPKSTKTQEHEKRQNDVIFIVWDVQKNSSSKRLSFDFHDE